jgi:hypothetical protein
MIFEFVILFAGCIEVTKARFHCNDSNHEEYDEEHKKRAKAICDAHEYCRIQASKPPIN